MTAASPTAHGSDRVVVTEEMSVLDLPRRIIDITGSCSLIGFVGRPVDDPEV